MIQRILSPRGESRLLLVFEFGIVAFGIYFRIAQYLFNRVIWGDEWSLIYNLINRSYGELFAPLERNQGAPIGFLLAERLNLDVFGLSEYSLRLFPLLCGVISLPILWIVARRLLPRGAVWVALILFAISEPLIYYAGEVKQYSTDVLVSLLILILYTEMRVHPLTVRRAALLALSGALLIWFSHPAIFILASISLALLIEWVFIDRARLRLAIPIFIVWGASFIASYLISLRYLSSNDYLLDFWVNSFPGSQGIRTTIGWALERMTRFTLESTPIRITQVALLSVGIGAAVALKQDRFRASVLLLPFVMIVVAAILHLYPFAVGSKRLVLFLFPFLFLLVALGGWAVLDGLRARASWWARLALAVYLLTPALSVNFNQPSFEPLDMRPIMRDLKTQLLPTDIIYTAIDNPHAYSFYFIHYDYVVARDLRGDLERLRAGGFNIAPQSRVWVFRNRILLDDPIWLDTLSYFDVNGQRQETIEDDAASAVLYVMN